MAGRHGKPFFGAAARTLTRLGVVRAAYVFGSHVGGTADAWSDIDVAAFIEGLEHWDIRKHATVIPGCH